MDGNQTGIYGENFFKSAQIQKYVVLFWHKTVYDNTIGCNWKIIQRRNHHEYR